MQEWMPAEDLAPVRPIPPNFIEFQWAHIGRGRKRDPVPRGPPLAALSLSSSLGTVAWPPSVRGRPEEGRESRGRAHVTDRQCPKQDNGVAKPGYG